MMTMVLGLRAMVRDSDAASCALLTLISRNSMIERRNSTPCWFTLSASHLSRLRYSRREANAATSKAKVKGRTSSNASKIYYEAIQLQLDREGGSRAYLQVLGHIKYAGDVEGTVFVELAEGRRQVRGIDLPDPHEHELVIGVASKEHAKQLLRVFVLSRSPRFLKRRVSYVSGLES